MVPFDPGLCRTFVEALARSLPPCRGLVKCSGPVILDEPCTRSSRPRAAPGSRSPSSAPGNGATGSSSRVARQPATGCTTTRRSIGSGRCGRSSTPAGRRAPRPAAILAGRGAGRRAHAAGRVRRGSGRTRGFVEARIDAFVAAAILLDADRLEASLDEMFAPRLVRAWSPRTSSCSRRSRRSEMPGPTDGSALPASTPRATPSCGVSPAPSRPPAGRSASNGAVLVGLPPGSRHELGALAFAVAARRAGLPVALSRSRPAGRGWVARSSAPSPRRSHRQPDAGRCWTAPPRWAGRSGRAAGPRHRLRRWRRRSRRHAACRDARVQVAPVVSRTASSRRSRRWESLPGRTVHA